MQTADLPFNVQQFRPPQPDAEIVMVDPQLAETWLAKNTRNRNIKKTKIAQYARDMAAGNWKMTGEAIKFGRDGALLDGQNRLHAVIASGATVTLLVIRGLDPDAQSVMDTGAQRSGADALAMFGVSQAKDVSAAASTYILWRRGFYRHCMVQPHSGDRPTHSEIVAAVQDAPDLIESATFAKSIQRRLPLPVGPLAVAHKIFVDLSADDAARYFDDIANLRTYGKGDPVSTLLRRVSETRARREQVWQATALFFLFRSWNARRNHEDLFKFQLGSVGRGWAPMPSPF